MRLHPGHESTWHPGKLGDAPLSTPWLTASAGMPWASAVSAAPTVPERLARGPMFSPKIDARNDEVGPLRDSPWSSRAQMMVSAGYPATALAGYPLAVVALVTVNVPAVTFAPVPL